MSKGDYFSPKNISNRLKAKGLQKLKWFCQMCQKQCRDENGFKCHCLSESHQRQMSLFAQNPDRFMNSFSREFEANFMDVLSRRFGTRKVNANQVYNEFIQDREHVHMNATIWATLSDFIKYLGRTGKCEIEETERGWDIQLIERDPDAIRRAEIAKKKREEQRSRDSTIEDALNAVAQAALTNNAKAQDEDRHLLPSPGADGSAVVLGNTGQFSGVTLKRNEPPKGDLASVSSIFADNEEPEKGDLPSKATKDMPPVISTERRAGYRFTADDSRKRLREYDAFDEQSKWESKDSRYARERSPERSKSHRDEHRDAPIIRSRMLRGHVDPDPLPKDAWALPGIYVEIRDKILAKGKYYKARGIVEAVEDAYIVSVRVRDDGVLIKLDSSDLQTVIPKEGRLVLILKGKYRGCEAVLDRIHVDDYCADLIVNEMTRNEIVLSRVDYDDFSRLVVD